MQGGLVSRSGPVRYLDPCRPCRAGSPLSRHPGPLHVPVSGDLPCSGGSVLSLAPPSNSRAPPSPSSRSSPAIPRSNPSTGDPGLGRHRSRPQREGPPGSPRVRGVETSAESYRTPSTAERTGPPWPGGPRAEHRRVPLLHLRESFARSRGGTMGTFDSRRSRKKGVATGENSRSSKPCPLTI